MSTLRLSIVTITYNASATLERTIRSVEKQDYDNIEYIIVDGASTDGTLDIVKSHSAHVSQYISEPDNGLYYAMNKGLALATGDYIWFVNAGDEIATPTTVSQMMTLAQNADVLYGDTVMTNSDGEEIGTRRLTPPQKLTWKSFKRGMLVSHQSFIAHRSICPYYDTQYRFSADIDWCIKILKQSNNIVNTQLTLSRFLDGGITKQNIVAGLKERFKIMTIHYGLFSTILNHIPITLKFFYFWITKGRF